MILKDIVTLVGLRCHENLNIEVDGIATFSEAGESDIAVAFNEKDIDNTLAQVVLVRPCLHITDKILIYSFDLERSYMQIAKELVRAGIYPDYSKPIQYTTQDAVCYGKNIVIGEGSHVGEFSCIGNNVIIGKDCYIGSNVTIGSDVTIGNNVTLQDGCRIGANAAAFINYNGHRELFPGTRAVLIEDGVTIGYNSMVQRGVLRDTIIANETHIGDMSAVGHDSRIGASCMIMGQCGIGGNVTIGNGVVIMGQCGIRDGITIGDKCSIYGKSAVTKSLKENEDIYGPYGRSYARELQLQAWLRRKAR